MAVLCTMNMNDECQSIIFTTYKFNIIANPYWFILGRFYFYFLFSIPSLSKFSFSHLFFPLDFLSSLYHSFFSLSLYLSLFLAIKISSIDGNWDIISRSRINLLSSFLPRLKLLVKQTGIRLRCKKILEKNY